MQISENTKRLRALMKKKTASGRSLKSALAGHVPPSTLHRHLEGATPDLYWIIIYRNAFDFPVDEWLSTSHQGGAKINGARARELLAASEPKNGSSK